MFFTKFKRHYSDSLFSTFDSIGASKRISQNLSSQFNINVPTAAQVTIFNAIFSGRDVVFRDSTGTGKTIGLIAALLSQPPPKIDKTRYLRSLFIAPTPELAIQVFSWAKALLYDIKPETDLSKHVQVLLPHTNYDQQTTFLKSNTPSLLIGTTRRLYETIVEQGVVEVNFLQNVVLDEVDTLVRVASKYESLRQKQNRIAHPLYSEKLMQFLLKKRRANTTHTNPPLHPLKDNLDSSQRKYIPEADLGAGKEFKPVPKDKRMQVIVASATINNALRRDLAFRNWLVDPISVDVTGTHVSPNTVQHSCIVMHGTQGQYRNMSSIEQVKSDYKEKLCIPALMDDNPKVIKVVAEICKSENITRGFVFVGSCISSKKIVEGLRKLGVKASRITEDMDLNEACLYGVSDLNSASNIKVFNKDTEILVVSEHNSRGIDLPDVTHSIIIGPCSSPASYLHMSGRVGRFGKVGKCIHVLPGERYERKASETLRLFNIHPVPLLQ